MLPWLALVLTSTGASVELPHVELAPPSLELAPVVAPAMPGGPRLVVVEERPTERSTARVATLAGSAASVATGVALTIWGLVLASDHRRGFLCVPSCDGGRWIRMFDRGLDSSLSGTGPAVVPLGLSLIGAGTVAGVGSELVEEGEVPWVSIVTGVVVGAVMYGVMEAAEDPIPDSLIPQ